MYILKTYIQTTKCDGIYEKKRKLNMSYYFQLLPNDR